MLSKRRLAPSSVRQQAGLSLVETMVGIAVGLIVVAAASLMVSAQLNDNRRLLLETQMQQDMRAAMDIIARELRRIGIQQQPQALDGIWFAGSAATANDVATSPTATTNGVGVDNFEFNYYPGSGRVGPYGFKLDSGVVKTQLGSAGWQELTDTNVMEVTAFAITPQNGAAFRLPCPKVCLVGPPTDCWPQVQVREFQVTLAARARSDPNVTRRISSNVRLRNDYVRFNTGSPAEICPA